MRRVQFTETVTLPKGPVGALIPVEGVAATPLSVNADGTEGSQATAYVDRTSLIYPSSLATDSSGTVSFWLDAGDYNVHMDDQQSPPRIASYVRGFTASIIDTTDLVVAAQNLIQFTGDTKFSLQTADHGLKPDGTYEWIHVVSDVDGGGRKLSHTLYPGLWGLMGSPTPDGLGFFRLPNISGRALIAVGAATGLTARNLSDLIGEETHALTVAEMANHNHVLTDPGHAHSATVSQQAGNAWFDGATSSIGSGSGGNANHDYHPLGVGVVINNQGTGITLANAGGGGSHNNMQPSYGMHLFVKS